MRIDEAFEVFSKHEVTKYDINKTKSRLQEIQDYERKVMKLP
jgi:hypothetical protein